METREERVLLLLTLIIGAVVGLVIAAFIYMTENLGARMYPAGGAPWRRLVIPTAGALFTGYLLSKYFPNARGSGIPQTKAALFLRDGFITFRTALGKFGLCSVTLASGIALGREGPSVHIGAGLASVFGRRLGLSPKRIRDLIPVGASAALAAAFNTPVAAVLFTLEEVMGDLHAPVLGSIVLSSATAWIVLHLLLGDEPLFHVPAYQLVSPFEFASYAVLGVVGGVVSVCFVKLLLAIRKRFLALPKWTVWLQPAAGGLLVGLMGWFVPDVLGVGYGHVSEALNGQMSLELMALLVVLKLIATAGCYGTGNAGGIFGPSLFIGAMMGGAVGSIAHQLAPDYTGGAGAYALVGMGAAFAGIVRVPLASVIMIFEMTRDYSIIVPLMISNLISFYISYRLQKEPIYEALQHQDGLHLPGGARARQETLVVRDAVTAPPHLLSKDDPFEKALPLLSSDRNAWPVTDGQRLLGMVSLADVQQEISTGHGARPLGVIPAAWISNEEISSRNFPHVHLDQPLDVALKRMADAQWNVLPVVSRSDLRALQGVVTLNGILQAYGIGSDRARSQRPPETTPEPSRKLIPGVMAVALALLILIGFLNYYYRSVRGTRAEGFYKTGVALAKDDRDAESIEQFRNALSVSPGSARYRLALGLELAKLGRLDEATVYLNEVLKTDPTNPEANLGLARIAAAAQRTNTAITYFHRAIDASWPAGQEQNRLQARLELADYLAKQNLKTQAVAELLAALPQVRDTPTKKRIAHLLLQHGSIRQSAELFQEIAQSNPKDAEAWSGLGVADMALEDYTAARDAFQKALRADPGEPTARSQLEISERVLALDPDARGIRASERYSRSQALLQGALQTINQCSGGGPDIQLAGRARKALAERARVGRLGDATEENLTVAIELRKERQQACPTYKPSDEALERVLARLANR
ncbi:MAG TPA: chloride channel protein [Bryobacteraceae bacterium]|nr:chloride channel protein [Bryobacteraceae bacterium]